MSLTQPATQDSAPTGQPTSSIPNEYNESGMQSGVDDVFAFDAPEETVEQTPDVTTIVEDDSTLPDQTQDLENIETEPVKSVVEPVKPAEQTELKLYADKFKTTQDLKNSFIELGGDPAQFGDNIQLLEQAYQIRQREYSRVRADIAHQNQTPPPVQKTVEQILQESFQGVDPTKFETPQQMWEAMMGGFGKALNEVQANQPVPQQGISPQDMAKHVRTVEAITNLESKVPRLKSDKLFRDSFAMHIRVLRDEGRMPMTPDGHQDLNGAFKNFVQGQSAIIEEANKAFEATNDAKTLSTATNRDSAPGNPAQQPRKNAGDALVDEILDYKAEYDRKYN